MFIKKGCNFHKKTLSLQRKSFWVCNDLEWKDAGVVDRAALEMR